jgi:hypothetical protein
MGGHSNHDINLCLPNHPIKVAPVSAIACAVTIVIALRYWDVGVLNRRCAVAAILFRIAIFPSNIVTSCLQLDVMIVLSSSSISTTGFILWMGSEEKADTIFVH